MLERRLEFESERALISHFAREKKMRQDYLVGMWEKRKVWADRTQHERKNVSGERGGKTRKRAGGGGAKRQFPELVQQLGTYTERAHGHQVLAKHLAWKYAALLKEESVRLEAALEPEVNLSEQEKVSMKLQAEKAKKSAAVIDESEKSRSTGEGSCWHRGLGRVPERRT